MLARDEWSSPPQSRAGASARDQLRTLPAGAEPLLRLAPPGRYQAWVKPVMDRVLAGLLLVLTLPLIAVASLAVLLALGRPVILRQERVGLDGEVFTIHKFRTMRPCRRSFEERRAQRLRADVPAQRRPRSGADRRQRHKHPHDPRLVKVGHFLRKWSLDELPQLYNVLRGDMSLVGPRPEMPQIVRHYEDWQHQRHLVKPGITGLWQVSDRGQDGALMHHRTDVDLHYVRELSLWLDLKLLLLTVPAALGVRRGI